METKVKTSFKSINSKIRKVFYLISLGIVGVNMSVYANNDLNPTQITEADAIVKNFVGIILTIFRYVGIILLVWAIAQLIMAFKNEDPDSKAKSITMGVISIILITLKSTINALNLFGLGV